MVEFVGYIDKNRYIIHLNCNIGKQIINLMKFVYLFTVPHSQIRKYDFQNISFRFNNRVQASLV